MPRLLPLFLLLLFSSSSAAASSSSQAQGAETPSRRGRGLVPVAPAEGELGLGAMALGLNDTRRRRRRLGGSFQLCAPCTCCGGDSRRTCVLAPCCYAINCTIPNRPFGYCSFMPKSCDCLGCNL